MSKLRRAGDEPPLKPVEADRNANRVRNGTATVDRIYSYLFLLPVIDTTYQLDYDSLIKARNISSNCLFTRSRRYSIPL